MDVENANCKLRVSECADMEILPIERPLKIEREVTGLETLIEELHRVFSKDHVNVQDVQKLMAGYKSDPKDWKKYAKFDRFRYTRNLVDAGNGAFNVMILCWGPGHASAIHDHADSHCFMKLLSGNLEEVRYDWPETIQPEILQKINRPRKRCCSETQEKLAQLALGCKNKTCPNYNSDKEENRETRNGVYGSSNETNGYDLRNQKNNGEFDDCTKENRRDINGNEDVMYESENMKEIGRTRLEVNDVCYINDALGLHRMENPSHVHGAVSLHLYCPPFDSCRVFDARTGKPTEVKVTFWSMYGKKVKRIVAHVNDVDSQE